MKKIVFLSLAMIAGMMSPGFAAEITVSNPVAVIEDGGKEIAVFMTITNSGSDPDVLYSAKTPFSKDIVIMSGKMDADHSAAAGIEIPAAGAIELKDGGAHIGLEGFANPPKSGDVVEVVLFFEEAGKMPIKATVK